MDQRLPPEFKKFLRLLASHEVEYLLIAATRSAITAISPQNAERMVAALCDFGVG
jgi:hypothetical protein